MKRSIMLENTAYLLRRRLFYAMSVCLSVSLSVSVCVCVFIRQVSGVNTSKLSVYCFTYVRQRHTDPDRKMKIISYMSLLCPRP